MRVQVSFDGCGSEDGLLLVPGQNLITGTAHFAKTVGPPTSLEDDLMLLASSVYAADLAQLRGQVAQFCRGFSLVVPVVNYQAMERIRADIQRLLYFLSGDNWSISFVQREGSPEPRMDWPESAGKTLLFSGGLDSLAGAIDLLEDGGNVTLVSHITHNQAVKLSQQSLFGYLIEKYGDELTRVPIRVGGQKKGALSFPEQREESQRTRSFLFLILAGLVARRSGHRDVVMIAENGQMAIHLPLSTGRIGAFSTHTAHPFFVRGMESLLSTVLGFDIRITNPFLYMTKAEVVRRVVTEHPEAIPLTVSCWRASRVAGEKNHCGACVPCLVRRISVEFNGLTLDEYDRNLLTEHIDDLNEDDIGKRNIYDLGEFISRFLATQDHDDFLADYPELADDSYDADRAVSMYRRFAGEAKEILRRYPGTQSVLT